MAKKKTYPFVPRSNATLEPGEFWGLPLSSGRFACGRVIDIPPKDDPLVAYNTRAFLAGLMDWSGDHPPTSDDLSGSQLIANGVAHVKTIELNGGQLLGHRSLELDGVRGLRRVSHRAGGTVYLYEGVRRVRAATRAEARDMPIRSTWGLTFISRLAERRFVEGLPLVD